MKACQGPELYFGLVAPVGTDLNLVESALRRQLEAVSYQLETVKLIKHVIELSDKNQESSSMSYGERMNAGNIYRQLCERNDAVALLAISAIRKIRKDYWDVKGSDAPKANDESPRPIPRQAYAIRSLKTPQEVELLRDIYGANFFLIAAYTPTDQRRKSLAEKLAASKKDPEIDRHRSEADDLIMRDEHEHVRCGQNVRKTFPLADVFIDARDKNTTDREIKRFVEILFGHPERTPSKDENAMFHAFSAKLRSSSAGRQVGSAISTDDGTIISLGANEVAKAGGGQYWEGDVPDHRDFNHNDSSREMREAILNDLLARLRKKKWLSPDKLKTTLANLLEEAEKELLPSMLDEAREGDDPMTLGEKAVLGRLVEFMRPVHAEMAALTDCARRGVSSQNCLMYITTFPCHECARLIVAAGIKRIVFIEPYPKSRTSSMYNDSISVDGAGDEHLVACEAFVGIAPRRFMEFFEYQDPRNENSCAEVKRVNKDGSWVDWNDIKNEREPRRVELPITIITRENDILDQFKQKKSGCDSQNNKGGKENA